MLPYFLFPKLRRYPEDMIFQQDVAPPHYSLEFMQYLDKKLPGRWMGREGPIHWPARSPDLTPCDFFLWSHFKNLVYRDPPRTIFEHKSKNRSVVATINEGTLQEVFRNMKTRLGFVVREKGSFQKSHELKTNSYVFPISTKKFLKKIMFNKNKCR